MNLHQNPGHRRRFLRAGASCRPFRRPGKRRRSGRLTRTMTNVLLVCHANTCRSVMAHVLLERMLAARGLGDVPVRSAGVARFARDGMLASLDARLVLREIGTHLTEDAFASTDLRRHPELLDAAAVVVTMTAEQKRVVGELAAAP